MLLMDAARYWDVSPQDAVLADERGAVWPDDAYVALELVSAPAARIALRIKATATVDDDEAEYYGREDNGSEISEEEEQDFMAIARRRRTSCCSHRRAAGSRRSPTSRRSRSSAR